MTYKLVRSASLIFVLTSGLLAINTNSTSESNNHTANVHRDYPPMIAYQRQFGPFSGVPMGVVNGLPGFGGMETSDAENVNFDFQCKCTSRSSIMKNMQAPVDANQAAQQQIQQLQDQVRRLQQQIQRSSSGKSSFEQFAQMLAQADGLECNCSGVSAPGSYPSQSYGRNVGMSGLPYGVGVPFGGPAPSGNSNLGNFMPPGPFAFGPMRAGPMTKAA